jgi:hypothetical protein
MVSLFTLFTTGGAVGLPETDPRLVSHEDPPVVVIPDAEPAAPTGDVLAEATPEQASASTSASTAGDGTSTQNSGS